MEDGLRFAIREGGRTVGAGVGCQDYRLIILSQNSKSPLFKGAFCI